MLERPPKQPFNYSAFIAELVPLVDQARAFDKADRREGSDAFRAWRYKVHDLITRIERQKYDVNCNLELRQFHVESYNNISTREQQERFERDLKHTLVELDHVIALYGTYGDPRAAKVSTIAHIPSSNATHVPAAVPALAPLELSPPDKVTFQWLWRHMSISAWSSLGALLVAAFALGTTIGAWPALQSAISDVGQAKTVPMAVAPAKAP